MLNNPRVITGMSAEVRLEQLGLDAVMLHRVAQRARAEAATCTAFDALGAAGSLLWTRMLRFVREELCTMGWIVQRPRGSELTISTEWGVKLLVISGDKWTGSHVGNPQPKHPKGPTFYQAVEDNQSPLDFGPEFADPTDDLPAEALDLLTTWMVVYHLTRSGDFKLEVSMPADTEDGQVIWGERIIIDVPPLDGPFDVPEGLNGDDPYSLTVERLG